MKKKLILSMMLMLLITLSGWTQQHQNWRIIKSKNDTIIQYDFLKQDLRDFRIYVTLLEQQKFLSLLDQKEITKLNLKMLMYQTAIENNNATISLQKEAIVYSTDMNKQLEKDMLKYKNKAEKWPYWLGGGFLGGIILCLLIR